MKKNRLELVEASLQKFIGLYISSEVNPLFSYVVITTNRVKVSPDLRRAKVFLSFYPKNTKEEKKVISYLKRNSFSLVSSLNKAIKMKYTPKLTWINDNTSEKVSKILKFLDQIK